MGNPIISIINSIFADIKNWILAIFLAIGVARIAWDGLKYKGADDMERDQLKRSMKASAAWFVGLPFTLWFVDYVWTKTKGVASPSNIEGLANALSIWFL